MSRENPNSPTSPREAGFGIRFAALAVDWLAVSLIITGLTGRNNGYQFEHLALFYIEVALLTSLMGASAGQRLFKLRVVDRESGGVVPPIRILVRTLLIVMVLPALFRKDGMAYHDAICKTAVIRS
jgi:uncharacterized RDD family membrane protein YckC